MIFNPNSRPDTRIVRWTGFTLTELMIVVTIIGLLAAMAIPKFVKARENTRLNVIYHNLRELDSAKQQWAFVAESCQFQVFSLHLKLKT